MFGHLKNKGIILTLWLDGQGSNPAIKDLIKPLLMKDNKKRKA